MFSKEFQIHNQHFWWYFKKSFTCINMIIWWVKQIPLVKYFDNFKHYNDHRPFLYNIWKRWIITVHQDKFKIESAFRKIFAGWESMHQGFWMQFYWNPILKAIWLYLALLTRENYKIFLDNDFLTNRASRSTSSSARQLSQNWLSFLAGLFHGSHSRISNKVSLELLIHAFSPCKGLVQSTFNFIQSSLVILCYEYKKVNMKFWTFWKWVWVHYEHQILKKRKV